MKKVWIGMLVVGVIVGLAFTVFSAEVMEKSEIKTKGGKTIEKTEVKAGDIKATEKITTTEEKTVTEEKLKGKKVKIEKKEMETAEGTAGKVKVHVKKGALNVFSINYNYFKQGTQYIIEYNVLDRGDPELLKELGLTKDQAKLVIPGKHTITSTSPYTADDVRADFRAVILKDLASTIRK